MASWNRLPAEMRLMILQEVASAHDPPKKGKKHLVSGYATVCKQWQDVFEKVNFGTITASPDELHEFGSTVSGSRRRWLRHLSFRVKLPKYSRKKERVPETPEEQEQNDVVFSMALWDLFEMLSTWDASAPEGRGTRRGIELELDVYSPSDRKVLSGETLMQDNGDNRFFDSDLTFNFDQKPDLAGPHGLPLVEVVSGLHILRRNRRSLAPQLLLAIISSLPRVELLRYEPWHQPDQVSQEDIDRDHAVHIPFWPATLKVVSIFEHADSFNRSYDDNEYEKCRQLGRNLCTLSLRLDELYVANFADARSFYEPFLRSPSFPKFLYWTHLSRLTLTSTIIEENEDRSPINTLLAAAGQAAKRMPQLQLLELYNADLGGAGVFRYFASAEATTAVWKSTWAFAIHEDVKKVWRDVARKHSGREVVFDPEQLLTNYRGPIRFIHHHVLTRGSILAPASSSDMMGKAAFPAPVL